MPLLEHAVADVDGLLPVERHDEMPAIGGDLERVPLAGGLGHRVDLGEVDDRAGAVARVGALVEDVDLVAGPGADGGGILASNEDAAVGLLVRPELGIDLEVLVRVLRDEVAALALVSDDCPVLDAPIGVARGGKVAHRLAVGHRHPARAGLPDRTRRKLNGDETGSEQHNAGRKRAYHDVVLPVSNRRSRRAFAFSFNRVVKPRASRHERTSATDASKRKGVGGRCRTRPGADARCRVPATVTFVHTAGAAVLIVFAGCFGPVPLVLHDLDAHAASLMRHEAIHSNREWKQLERYTDK